MKHTKGPWIVKETPDGMQLRVDNIIGYDAETGPSGTVGQKYAVTDTVAICFNAPKPNAISQERRANACLIAAAPELLEALKECVAALDSEQTFDWKELYQRACLAIAKAEGNSELDFKGASTNHLSFGDDE